MRWKDFARRGPSSQESTSSKLSPSRSMAVNAGSDHSSSTNVIPEEPSSLSRRTVSAQMYGSYPCDMRCNQAPDPRNVICARQNLKVGQNPPQQQMRFAQPIDRQLLVGATRPGTYLHRLPPTRRTDPRRTA